MSYIMPRLKTAESTLKAEEKVLTKLEIPTKKILYYVTPGQHALLLTL